MRPLVVVALAACAALLAGQLTATAGSKKTKEVEVVNFPSAGEPVLRPSRLQL